MPLVIAYAELQLDQMSYTRARPQRCLIAERLWTSQQ